ncbi:uncharacterized protein LACBIDRAFT_186862 [Laccaria bicolor S238N-H82]|uniref:non-specific serine/threonine protein kinase n=1 Tax=Laccaria bicolor (strain S238N-H82 / ATCC MYA-4686) TaxID=486041 RepID=B0CP54_LACBS|nr:uncharacterized protein LACBIDRAFT_186862 [Laccaria bicolor S238N-H82]EDR16045.1 predicted protein [Laccaria bicolor S238N-H82]|eukprot:XP_001874253.1 predicted protein [Laccaria bicolor S238N-H82]
MASKQPCARYQYVVTPAGPKILPVDEPSCKDEESPADYNAGGYLPVKVGDAFKHGRYRVIRKLGWGHFSTVWLVKDTQTHSHSALKVVKSAGRYAETARDEIKLLSQVSSFAPTHQGRSHIVSFLDSFSHQGPEASHICIVFEPLGENLLALIERNKKKGVPRPLVKVIAKQILLGLQYLHDECDLVHTDIKPENILISIPDIEAHIHSELSQSPSPTSRRVGVPLPTNQQRARRQVQIFNSQPLASPGRSVEDSGSGRSSQNNSFIAQMHLSRMAAAGATSREGLPMKGSKGKNKMTPLQNELDAALSTSWRDKLSPTLASSYQSTSSSHNLSKLRNQDAAERPPPISVKIADLGNATPSTKHYTEDIQTRQYRAPEAIVGRRDWDDRADIWSVACVIFELLTAEYLFDPQGQGELFTKDDDHMAQIIELLGNFPLEAKMGGKYSRELFDHTGALRYIRTLKPWPLKRVMTEKYLFTEVDAASLCSFLQPMLAVDMRERVHARDMIEHSWLTLHGEDEAIMEW